MSKQRGKLKKCTWCGSPFWTRSYGKTNDKQTTCSTKCSRLRKNKIRAAQLARPKAEHRCVVCGSVFLKAGNFRKKTCSKACGRQLGLQNSRKSMERQRLLYPELLKERKRRENEQLAICESFAKSIGVLPPSEKQPKIKVSRKWERQRKNKKILDKRRAYNRKWMRRWHEENPELSKIRTKSRYWKTREGINKRRRQVRAVARAIIELTNGERP